MEAGVAWGAYAGPVMLMWVACCRAKGGRMPVWMA